MLTTILLVFAFGLAVCAAASVSAGRISLGWAAFACYIASMLFGRVG
jgi:hypothetical protein